MRLFPRFVVPTILSRLLNRNIRLFSESALFYVRTSNLGAEAERSYLFYYYNFFGNLTLKSSYDVLKLPVIVF